MQSNRRNGNHPQDNAIPKGQAQSGRGAPQGMPRDVPSQGRVPKQTQKPRDVLPEQRPVTDDEVAEIRPARWKTVVRRIGVAALICVALSMAYIFLLLGEPEPTAEEISPAAEEVIRVPMAAVEAQGSGDISTIVATFGKPVLALYGGLTLQKSSLYDTAFHGGYARRAILTYAFDDGQLLVLDSIRPTAAAELLAGSQQTTLRVGTMYSLAGIDAARMDSEKGICVFAKGDEAVYAVTCPSSHAAELGALLKQTTLLQP